MYLFFGILLLILILFFWLNHRRRKQIICKVKSLCMNEKCRILDDIIQPLGYSYVPAQDLFTSRVDAWQREFGYCGFYDDAAVWLGMVFDCLPVYFNYHGRTWLIELWKGQYGINLGCEMGVYHADRLLNENERKHALFHAVENEEMPELCLTLSETGRKRPGRGGNILAKLCARHWWLTAFRMGCFARPADLQLSVCITLQNQEMAEAFLRGLLHAGYNRAEIQLCYCTVTFTFARPKIPPRRNCFRRLLRRIVLWFNHLWCRLYLWVTRPFQLSIDRILYLYYYLPFVCRRLLRLRRFRKRRPKKCRIHKK